jgi:hypothetical protein
MAAKSKKLVLDTSDFEEDFFEDSTLFGLRATEEPYHIIWLINKILKYEFKINKYYAALNNYNFNLYEFDDKKNAILHSIYTNKLNGKILIQEQKGYQFLWLIKGYDNRFYTIQDIKDKLKTNETFALFQQLDIDNIKSKSLLII